MAQVKVHNPTLGKAALADFNDRIAAVRVKHPGAVGGTVIKEDTFECGICGNAIVKGADHKWTHV